MKIIIKTLTPAYDKVEDRIRLSINYQDMVNRIDLMITRDFILKLLPTFEEYLYTHYPNSFSEVSNEIAVDSMDQKDQNKNNEKQNNIHKTNMEDLQIYQEREELLVTVNFSFDKNTNLTILSFITKNKTQCLMQSDDMLLKSILNSIKEVVPKFSWGIGYL